MNYAHIPDLLETPVWDENWENHLLMSVKATDFITRFFVFAPSFSVQEGDEERKLLFHWPEDDLDVKLRHIGYTEAFKNFTQTFTGGGEPFVEVGTDKDLEVSVEVEKGYYVSFGCSISLAKKTRYALRAPVLGQILHNFYCIFRLYFGRFDDHVIRVKGQRHVNPEQLRRRLAHFCPNFLDLLRLHVWPLMDLLEGVNYMYTDPTNFLKIQSIFNRVIEQFPGVKNCMLMCNDRLLYHTLPKNMLVLLYKYMVDILLPKIFRRELQPENRHQSATPDLAQEAGNNSDPSPSPSPSPSPALELVTNFGQFVSGESFVYPITDGKDADRSMHGFPQVYLYDDQDGSKEDYYLVVYRIFTVTLLALVPCGEPAFLNADFKSLLDSAVGSQMTDLAYSLTDIWAKLQNDAAVILPYPYIYYNGANLQLYCTLTPAQTLLPMAPPHILYGAMFDLRQEMNESSYFGSVLTKSESDYWIVAKKAGSRELYSLAHRKNATMIEVNDEINKLCAQKFENEFLVE